MSALVIWRHPKPEGAQGLCVGCTNLRVDRRRAKRLAHRIRAQARRRRWPREVWTSPLERGAAVGRWLRRFGFVHHTHADLCEMDFGSWAGRRWRDIGSVAVAAWEHDFMHHAPGGAESLAQLFSRVQRFAASRLSPCLIVGHAGWISAWCWLHKHAQRDPSAAEWPAPPRYGERIEV